VSGIPLTRRDELELYCRERATGVFVGDETLLCRVLGRFAFYADAVDVQIVPNLVLDGFWEAWNTVAIARNVRPGARVVDVGANHGYFTLLLAEVVGPQGHVFAFEPNPRLFELLERNVRLNGFERRVTLIRAAAAARDGQGTLVVDRRRSGEGSLVLERGAERVALPVALQRVDGAVSGPIDFMKVDVEGADYEVLAGAAGLLEDGRTAVLIEHHAGYHAEPRARLLELQAQGFRLSHVRDDGEVVDAGLDPIAGDAERFWSLWLSRGERTG
jgi:FkbM family methyltransferase